MSGLSSLRRSIAEAWMPILGYVLAIGGLIGLFFFRLKILLPGLSSSELSSINNASFFSNIQNNPLNLPHTIMQWLVSISPYSNIATQRAVSSFFGVLAVVLFYYVLRSWHTTRIAILGTVLFASSSWLLHISRLAVPMVLDFLVIAGFAYGCWLKKTSKVNWPIIVGCLLALTFFYIPGFIWLLLLAAVTQVKQIKKLASSAPAITSVGVIITLILLAPLAMAISKNNDLLYSWLGVPNLSDLTAHNMLVNLVEIPKQLFWHGPTNPVLWLGNLPILDIFTVAMLTLGIYAYFFQRSLHRTRIIVGSLVVGVGLIVVGGLDRISLLIPVIYLISATGLSMLLQRWLMVFPRNPLARSMGVIILTIAVGVSVFYNLNRYFIAWPQTPATKQAFTHKL